MSDFYKQYDLYFQQEEEAPFAFQNLGFHNCPPGHMFSGVRNCFVLHYVKSGTGEFSVSQKKYRLAAGSLFLIRPQQSNLYRADSQNPWNYTYFHFSGPHFIRLLEKCNLTENNPVLILEKKENFEKRLEQLWVELKKENPFRSDLANAAFHKFLIEIACDQAKPMSKRYRGNSYYIDQTKKFISANYMKNIRVEGMAKYLGISRSYFSALFHEEEKQSIQDYLINYRLQKAEEYLQIGALSIQEIALSCGFNSYIAFASIYKKRKGCSPTEFQKRSLSY